MERLLTFADISEQTGIPEATLRYWRHLDQGPESFRIGRRVYVPESKYQEWYEEMTKSTREQAAS